MVIERPWNLRDYENIGDARCFQGQFELPNFHYLEIDNNVLDQFDPIAPCNTREWRTTKHLGNYLMQKAKERLDRLNVCDALRGLVPFVLF